MADRRNYDLAESWVSSMCWRNAVSDRAGNLTPWANRMACLVERRMLTATIASCHTSVHSRTTLIISSACPAVAPHLRG